MSLILRQWQLDLGPSPVGQILPQSGSRDGGGAPLQTPGLLATGPAEFVAISVGVPVAQLDQRAISDFCVNQRNAGKRSPSGVALSTSCDDAFEQANCRDAGGLS
jgi:hypothetical protein